MIPLEQDLLSLLYFEDGPASETRPSISRGFSIALPNENYFSMTFTLKNPLPDKRSLLTTTLVDPVSASTPGKRA